MSTFITNLYSKIINQATQFKINFQHFWFKMSLIAATSALGLFIFLRKFKGENYIPNLMYGNQGSDPLSKRCEMLRQKIEKMSSPENAALVFTVTDDYVINQSKIPFICQEWRRKILVKPAQDTNGGFLSSLLSLIWKSKR